jgi:hypothetical protein
LNLELEMNLVRTPSSIGLGGIIYQTNGIIRNIRSTFYILKIPSIISFAQCSQNRISYIDTEFK